MPLIPGQVLDNHYRVVKMLAQGGYGTVYRAWDIQLNGPCALKENQGSGSNSRSQFEIEATMLASLSHPNLPKVRDHLLIPDGQFIVMDFIEGEDLQVKLNQSGGSLAEVQVLNWIYQVCDALTYMHNQNPPVIHRDIKPANIRISPQGKAVLVDFGIAKQQAGGRTRTGARAVTSGYSPPEQYTGQGTSVRSDIYALGATLYTLLTGLVLPESIQRLITPGGSAPIVVKPPHMIRPGITIGVSQVIMRAIHPDPAKRFASVKEFEAALRGGAAGARVAPQTTTYQPNLSPVGLPVSQSNSSAMPLNVHPGSAGKVSSSGHPGSKAATKRNGRFWLRYWFDGILVCGVYRLRVYISLICIREIRGSQSLSPGNSQGPCSIGRQPTRSRHRQPRKRRLPLPPVAASYRLQPIRPPSIESGDVSNAPDLTVWRFNQLRQ
jgi:serine/threonine protein kinase